MTKIELFCVAHREPPVVLPPGVRVIGVNGFQTEGGLSDALGNQQISAKNSRFCELTALYWLVHNHNFSGTHAGICHYRRVWSDEKTLPASCLYGDEYLVSKSKYPVQNYVSSLDEVGSQMASERSDLVLPGSVTLANGVAQHYKLAHDLDDLVVAFNLAISKGLLNGHFVHYFLAQKELFPYNMGILPVDKFISIWKQVIEVLLEIEDQIPLKQEVYQDRPFAMLRTAAYQNRVFGFLAERLYSAILMAHLWQAKPKMRASSRAVMMVVD